MFFKDSKVKYPNKEIEIAIKKLENQHNREYSKKDIKMLNVLKNQIELFLNDPNLMIVNPDGHRELKKMYDELFSEGVY